MIKNTGDETPICFGKHYDSKVPECVGGHDPAYLDENGSHVREPCNHRGACSARMQALRNLNGIVPTSSPTRPSTGFNRPPTAFTQPSAPIQPFRTQSYPMTQGHQSVGMQQMVPVNYGIPQYLSVREPLDGRTMAARLFMEVFRSIFKALGHTVSNFFDTEVFGRKHNGGPPQT